jgi:organic hydroperoxide reductase OsmC/OhrA
MAKHRIHEYRLQNRWTGNLGTGTSAYSAYSRNYEMTGETKSAAISGSSDPAFRGDRTRYNPEELLLGAASACHMLWVLHWCADAGIIVNEYVDDAIGEMLERSDGSGEFTRITLRPRIVITDDKRVGDVLAIHTRVHEVCAISRSVNFPVAVEPAVKVQVPT